MPLVYSAIYSAIYTAIYTAKVPLIKRFNPAS